MQMQSILLYEGGGNREAIRLLAMRIDLVLPKLRDIVKMACLIFWRRLWPEGLTLFQHI